MLTQLGRCPALHVSVLDGIPQPREPRQPPRSVQTGRDLPFADRQRLRDLQPDPPVRVAAPPGARARSVTIRRGLLLLGTQPPLTQLQQHPGLRSHQLRHQPLRIAQPAQQHPLRHLSVLETLTEHRREPPPRRHRHKLGHRDLHLGRDTTHVRNGPRIPGRAGDGAAVGGRTSTPRHTTSIPGGSDTTRGPTSPRPQPRAGRANPGHRRGTLVRGQALARWTAQQPHMRAVVG